MCFMWNSLLSVRESWSFVLSFWKKLSGVSLIQCVSLDTHSIKTNHHIYCITQLNQMLFSILENRSLPLKQSNTKHGRCAGGDCLTSVCSRSPLPSVCSDKADKNSFHLLELPINVRGPAVTTINTPWLKLACFTDLHGSDQDRFTVELKWSKSLSDVPLRHKRKNEM